MIPSSGYVNGSDLLISVAGQAMGHCTSHTTTFNSETKDRAVKPAASVGYTSGLWKGKGVTGLSISISAEGLRYYGETENGFEEIAEHWGVGQSVQVKAFATPKKWLSSRLSMMAGSSNHITSIISS